MRHRAKQLASEYPGLGEVLGKIADGITVEGMEAFAPLLADRMELLLDSLPAGALVVACDPERIRARAADLVRTSQEFLEASWINAAAGAEVPIDLGGAAFRPITEVRAAAASLGVRWWTITPFGTEDPSSSNRTLPRLTLAGPRRPRGARPGTTPAARHRGRSAHGGSEGLSSRASTGGWPFVAGDDESSSESFRMRANPATAYHGDTSRVIGDVRGWLSGGWRVALVTEGHGPAQRLAEILRGENIGARASDLDEPPEPGVAIVATGLLDAGFVWPQIKLAVLGEDDISGQRTGGRDRSRMPSRRRGGIDPLQLTPGDYVVHSQHGVGRYLEMTSRTIQGATREYLVIEYAPGSVGSRRTGCTCRPTSWTR